MSQTVVLTHPELPGVEYACTRAQYEGVWQAAGWVENLPEGGDTPVPELPKRRAPIPPAEPVPTSKEN
ncbi:hypothetical protein AB0K09_00455 [Streptomyces sp. NPDC049577]|uniref:hypothetical protein n=1 Tax=Streptomyces sp. NPDC049577 TaxID=3155153 RepID=UPI003440D857